MKLIDCDPRWTKVSNLDMGGHPERHGMGLSFTPPDSAVRVNIWFKNPIDGGPPINEPGKQRCLWDRSGDTFETLTLHPSIDDSPRFHGWIRNGEVTKA